MHDAKNEIKEIDKEIAFIRVNRSLALALAHCRLAPTAFGPAPALRA
jgi:hypothetical protein